MHANDYENNIFLINEFFFRLISPVNFVWVNKRENVQKYIALYRIIRFGGTI